MSDFDFDLAPSESGGSPAQGARPGEIPSFMNALNDRQREAALATEGPLIVLAGAGSGKTKMLTSRIAYLIQGCGVAAHEILAVTFTNKAAGEMRERVEKMLDAAAQAGGRAVFGSPEIGTFHSVCVRILRREAACTPFTKPFVIYDDSDQLSLVKSAMRKLSIDEKAFSPKSIQGAINRVKCDALEPHEIDPSPHNIFERQMKRVYEQYQKDLFANNALDFGEILAMTYRIFRDHLEVRAKYQRRFRYIHVDEYQDTNRAQYLLLSMLAGAVHGGHQNICVVGDEDQSIYKWRGADIRNILDFENDYPGAKVVKLEQNYRSTKTIITGAGAVIRNNSQRKEKTLWTDNEQGLPIVRAQLADERAEAEMVVSEIKRLAEHEARAYGDFSIFYRTNAQSRQFEDILRREKIPYQIVGGLRFYDRKEIKDILSYFKVILNPDDSVSLKRIINVPGRGIGKTTLEKLDQLHAATEGTSFWDSVVRAGLEPSITSAGTAKKLGAFARLIDRLIAEQPKLLLSELYHLILDETGYVRDLRHEATEESLARIENLEEFDTLLQEFEEDWAEKVPEEQRAERKKELLPLFIEQSTLASDADSLDAYASSVKLMTLHSSKGLEFPVVFMVGMEDGIFPSVRPWEETPNEDIEEERRLCYVGMTRARQLLYMLNVVVRRIWGTVSYQEPSRFFAEIPEELVSFKNLSHGARSIYGSGSSRSFGSAGGSTGAGSYTPFVSNAGATSGSAPWSQRGPAPVSSANDLVGRKMSHPDYGLGTVVASDGSGEDRKVTVEFRGRQQRKFLLRYVAAFIED